MTTNLTHRKNLRRSRRRGFTLTEIAIVLGIIGLILGSIWVAAAAVYNNLRIAHANTAILQIAQGARTLLTTQQNVGSATDLTPTMISAKVIPADLITSTTTAQGPWAGSTLKVLSVAATDTAYTIELNNVPQSACIALLSTVAGASRDPGLTSVGGTTAQVVTATSAAVSGGTAGTALTVATPPVPLALPVTAGQAALACSSTSNANLVQFQFSLK